MGKVYRDKNKYIGLLKQCLTAREDFGDLLYRRDHVGNEYLIMSDIVGQVLILNVTGYNEENLLNNIATIVCGKTPVNLITDRSERLRIGKLR